MPITPERVDILRTFGLSEYGCRAYLALLELGETEARDVSRLARVPIAKVYHVLDGLQARGLCQSTLTTPKRYAPLAFGEFLDRIAAEHRRSIDAVERQRATLESTFVVVGGVRTSDRGRAQLLQGRSAALDQEVRLLALAQQDVLMVCTPGRLLRLRHMFPELEKLRQRGVHVRSLVPLTTTWAVDRELLAGLGEVRVRGHDEDPRSDGVAVVIIDREHALIVDAIPDDDDLRKGHDVGVHITQEGIVSAVCDMAEALWTAAPAAPDGGVRVRQPRVRARPGL